MVRKHDLDVPRDAKGSRIKDGAVVKSGANKRVEKTSYSVNDKVYALGISGSGDDEYALEVNGIATEDLDFDATAAEIQVALNAVTGPGTAVVTAVEGNYDENFEIRFQGKYSGKDVTLVLDDTELDENGNSEGEVAVVTEASQYWAVENSGSKIKADTTHKV